jgi:hypothetical protein
MDGQQLGLEDGSFDATSSLLGASISPTGGAGWRSRRASPDAAAGLRGDMAQTARRRTIRGHGASAAVRLSGHASACSSRGFLALAEPGSLAREMSEAGLSAVDVEEIEVVWEGPAGPAYLNDVHGLHRYMGAYAMLDDGQRRRIDEAVLAVIDPIARDDRVVLRSTAVLAVGTKR